MRTGTKTLAKALLHRLGYDVRRLNGEPAQTWEVLRWIRDSQRIRTIVDIGANNGDFAIFLAGYFDGAAVHAFEPLQSCAAELRAKAAARENFHVYNVALSDQCGEAILYENSYAPASSLLHVSATSRTEFPETSGETPRPVRVARLDDVLGPAAMERDLLVKIDVQGMEDRVIRGGREVFAAAGSVLVEVSFVAMYEGQPLFEEVHEELAALGLRFAGCRNQIVSRMNGRPLFAHCLYVRPSGTRSS